MKNNQISRRQALQAAAILGTGLIFPINSVNAKTRSQGKTPGLTPDEIALIDVALGKKGLYKQAESAYTTSLPRNDLKMKIKGEVVPIPFGFGGWVSFK